MEREEPSPILAAERAQEAGGLWTTQKYGDFAQGDKRLASAFVTGRVEMRQLRGLFKLTFSDLAVVRRRTEDDGSKKPLRAGVFLTRKKTKKRMADLEETGYSVPVGGDVDEDGYVCVGERSLGAFDLTLRDAPEDPLVYRGLCIAKRAGDAPLTEEPAVYGYVRFIDDRPEMPTTEHALGLLENQDLIGECVSLRVLDLQSNVIAEIPANLACLVNLKKIYLGKNLLRALPLDVVNLCETVDELHLDRNPFGDLPPRWAKFIGKSAHERSLWPSGYDDAMAIAWVKDHAAFYDAAVAEWDATGPLHVSGRSNLAAYEVAVQKRCGPSWMPHLLPLVRAYYFKTRRTGNCPKFNRLADAEVESRARTKRRADAIRDVRHGDALEAAAEYEDILNELYYGDLLHRADRAVANADIRDDREVLQEANREAGLLADVGKRETRQKARTLGLEAERRREERLELEELHEHLWETYGRPADGEHFFPPIHPLLGR